ncbi:purine nucleoside permease [Diaporthe amygdali]|uniref:purine nucleoside permease n=1 Tax=Phomopsis amygdali TaxID=1214568 RepID=UPI0022FDBFDF|nr:purine nucleoside permease [Diaporthe amygdali]KAJ0122342.1 purine nucleoside permease [Diaporthe amygdali]
MRFFSIAASALLAVNHAAAATVKAPKAPLAIREAKMAPKFFIISMFTPEADIWYEKLPDSGLGDLLAVNISTPGLSMLFPHIHCTEDFQICQVTTGESEINAAATITSVVLSDKFDLTSTYFMIGGIAGVSPEWSTLGGVALSRYAVQVALQYEFDAREMPENYTTGYVGYGTLQPGIMPETWYGTEVLEVNEDLRQIAYKLASKANLSDNAIAAEYRERYVAAGEVQVAATLPPSVVLCDSATSDVYYSGKLLAEAFDNTTTLWTNGSGHYCMTAQEDNATLEVLLRMAIEGLVDFSRIILMRTGSDFDRPPPGTSAYDHLLINDQNGFEIAVENIYYAGVEIAKGILSDWNCTFKAGVKASNYIGDVFGSLGGEPDFGPGSITDGLAVLPDGKTGDLETRDVEAATDVKGKRAAAIKRSKGLQRRRGLPVIKMRGPIA